ncbi:MAG: galactose mutarotase [Dysgonamonadaceae bacterium]|jgi:aldose 1-epimerase|nr:galactose mutarotase [Dysgonamonadaceae bacterium]
MKRIYIVFVCCAMAALSACTTKVPTIERLSFGKLSTGEEVTLYRLKNGNGSSVDVIDYGCRIVRICVPDRNGVIDDVVPGYGNIRDFEFGKERFFGALIGRYGNRISNGSFMLDSLHVQLSRNEKLGEYSGHLHGGEKGFDRVMWEGEPVTEQNRLGVKFRRISPDGEEGYPGNLDCEVIYWWNKDNVLKIEYRATTDKPTIVNLSNHTYFNLKGADGGYIMDHILCVEADKYLPNTDHYVPKGTIEPVEGTPFDMREPHRVDYAIDTPNEHLQTMHGFSVTWVLRNQTGELAKAADLWEPRSGRGVETWTTEPGLLTYTGRGLSEAIVGKEGKPLEKFGGMLLETLHFPDSPNHPEYPSTKLYPGQTYYSTTEFKFYVK